MDIGTPAQPTCILRGHTSQIHSVRFVHRNCRLLTGDAEGRIILWAVSDRRPLWAWEAHQGAILGLAAWGCDKIITHGRDHFLRIWQVRDMDKLSAVSPIEIGATLQPKPWLLHALPVNTLNFCAFSMCCYSSESREKSSVLVATPATDDKQINVYQFPDEQLRYIVPRVQNIDTGMVMALKLLIHPKSNSILLLSGYEGGLTAIHQLPTAETSSTASARLLYLSQPHTQPVLSLDALQDATAYFTSSADAIIAAHCITEALGTTSDSATSERGARPEKIDYDPLISPKLGSRGNSISNAGGPSLSFEKQTVDAFTPGTVNPGGLSSLLSSVSSQHKVASQLPQVLPDTIQMPYKTVNTKHAGQQSLCVRSDGRLLVTGGWDGRVRIYSSRTLKEVAVLKWHKQGVYAVDFADILHADDLQSQEHDVCEPDQQIKSSETGLNRLRRQREELSQCKHWIAAGAKDGKVSLWEVF